MEIMFVVRERDWRQLDFPMSPFSFTHFLLQPIGSAPLLSSSLQLSPFSLPGYFPSASFLHAALLNLSRLSLFFFCSFASLYSAPSFSHLFRQLQMSNPSTAQVVSSIVYKCVAPHV